MGLLDIPRGLISHLPLVGGSNDSEDDSEDRSGEDEEPVAKAPEEPKADEPPEDEPDKPAAESDEKPSDGSEKSGDDTDTEDISGTTAPSIGPNTVIEKDSPEERLARHEQSDTDAMGLDKRRQVIGGNYNAGIGKQLTRWIAVVVVVAAAAFGLKLLVDDLDKPPAHVEAKAPWSGTEKAPAPLE
jgi:hypothetical protein